MKNGQESENGHPASLAVFRENNERFRYFVEHANDIVYALSPEGLFTYVSPNWLDFMGEPAEKAVGASFEPYVHPDDVQLCRDFLKSVLTTGDKKGSVEYRVQRRDGVWRWHVSKASPIRDDAGNITGYIGIARDITERRRAEEALRQNQAMLARTERIANVGSWEWDIAPDHVRWSDELFRIFGRDPAMGAPSFAEQADLYVAEDVQRLRQAVERCVAEGTPYELELRGIHADGAIRHCVARGLALRDRDGLIYRLAGSLQDITGRRRDEETIRAHDRYLQAILQTAADGFLVIDTHGRVIEVNDAYCLMSGYLRDELLTMNIGDLDVDESSEDIAARIQGLIAKGSDLFETRHRRKDASVFPVEVSATWLDENGGEFVTFCRDISERKRAEEERERLQAQLLQAQKMEAMGRLAGGVAHDFNNMLGAILGHAELAMGKAPSQDESLCADLKAIVYAANHSADITRQLLAFARKQTIQPKVLNLNQTVEGMLKMLRRIIGEDIDLTWSPGDNLWPVRMDPSQIDQILVNLCVNARDAIEDVGKLVIATETVTCDEASCAGHAGVAPGDFVLITVSDDGRGMDQQTLDKVFEPFFTTKGQGKGTGLGLATVYGIVQQNHGFICVDSEIGKGTTFRIYLPAFKEGKAPRTVPEQGGVLLWPRGSETILLVEDEQAILKMTTMMLELLGYTVLAADTPGKAIDLAREHADEIHLLMTDVIMPAMNGRELAKNLLTLYPKVKCLFMSGYTANVIEHHGVMKQGVHFLQKPFSVRAVAAKVRQALDEP